MVTHVGETSLNFLGKFSWDPRFDFEEANEPTRGATAGSVIIQKGRQLSYFGKSWAGYEKGHGFSCDLKVLNLTLILVRQM